MKTNPTTDPIFGATIALSAFLLFQVQLIVGKAILPWFGGTAAVWTTCMLVFQLLLLGGYGYAHFLSSRFSPKSQGRVHIVVLGIAVLVLVAGAIFWRTPILPSETWKPHAEGSPVWEIMRMLLATVAIPFFVLSTTGSLVQRWFAHTYPGSSPYRLYSLSNFGSLLGLLCYPFVIEPMLSLKTQAWAWSGLFFVFVVVCSLAARRSGAVANEVVEAEPSHADEVGQEPTALRYVLWMALPAVASAMLLAVTNHICQDVAVIPFLWIVPLSIYLFSFILTFDTPKWYRRSFFHPLYAVAVVGAICGLVREYPVPIEILFALIAMFSVCMVMHGELVKLKPRTRHLTAFYLMISAGGALGGFLVSIVAPQVFPAFWEYHLSLFMCGALAYCVLLIDRDSWLHKSRYASVAFVPLVLVALVPIFGARFVESDFWDAAKRNSYYSVVVVLALSALYFIVRDVRRSKRSTTGLRFFELKLPAALILAVLGSMLIWQILYQPFAVIEQRRSFFGVRTVFRTFEAVGLRHGATIHGWQYIAENRKRTATSYYTSDTGVGLLMANYPRPADRPANLRVGVLGLGVGTLAVFSHPGDTFRFYEIDPVVAEFSLSQQPRFTFLKGSPAKMEVILGDGRLSLEREEPQKFDILVLDAFSSDSVPVHLLTREAMKIYRKHLRGPQSIIVFNITNRVLDLRPVLAGLAKDSGMGMVSAGAIIPAHPVKWVLMCEDRDFLLSIPGIRETARNINLSAEPPVWTDDYSNPLQVIQF